MAEIRELAEPLQGKRVLHVNATAFGGGVAEILYTLVPLMKDVGLEAEWRVMTAPPAFFNVTKGFHNGLQGHDFERHRRGARDLRETSTAPTPTRSRATTTSSSSMTRSRWPCAPSRRRRRGRRALDLALPHRHVDARPAAVRLPHPVHPRLRRGHLHAARVRSADLGVPVVPIAPCIDPLAPKNMALSPRTRVTSPRQFGIDVERPLLLQVSRFDPWKDPLGVVDVYRAVKAKYPDVQLALVGSMASDDPEGWEYLEKVIEYVGSDHDVFVLSNLDNVGSVEINAFQSQAAVIMQKSTREGFGLTVSEALWKARPTIGGAVGGIPLQIQDGVTGYLVDSVAECAQRCVELLNDPQRARRWRWPARSMCATTSSRRACCATTCASLTTC